MAHISSLARCNTIPGRHLERRIQVRLEITRNGEEVEVSFAYQKKIPLIAPVSLVFDFEGTTAKTPLVKKPVEK